MISKVRATALAASCLIAYGVYGCSSDSGNDNPNNPLSDGGTPVGDSQPEGDANGTGIHIDASHPDTGGGDDDGGGSTVVAWPSDACVTKTKALVAQMSRQQKAGQMVIGDFLSRADSGRWLMRDPHTRTPKRTA